MRIVHKAVIPATRVSSSRIRENSHARHKDTSNSHESGYMKYLKPARTKVNEDTTSGSVRTFARIVVNNGPTLTPNLRILRCGEAIWGVSCHQNQDCQGCSGFLEEPVTVIDINKMVFLLGKTPADCAKSPYPSKFPPSLIHATGIKLSKRDI